MTKYTNKLISNVTRNKTKVKLKDHCILVLSLDCTKLESYMVKYF